MFAALAQRYCISRLLIFPILLVASCSYMNAQTTSASQRSQRSIKLTISSAESNFKIGDEIRIRVELTNISNSPIVLSRDISGKGEFSYHTSVLVKGGGEVAKTKYLKALRGEPMDKGSITITPGSSVLQSIKPSESTVESINLSSLYKLSDPGVYILRVERRDPVTKLEVASNALEITLTPLGTR